jgi:hypothetical protein
MLTESLGIEEHSWLVCQWLAIGWWFSPGPPFTPTNITEILMKVPLNTIKPKPNYDWLESSWKLKKGYTWCDLYNGTKRVLISSVSFLYFSG